MDVTPEPTPREVLGPLVLPIYAPTLLQAVGATAVLPLVPLMALTLGFGVPAAAALALLTGVIAIGAGAWLAVFLPGVTPRPRP